MSDHSDDGLGLGARPGLKQRMAASPGLQLYGRLSMVALAPVLTILIGVLSYVLVRADEQIGAHGQALTVQGTAIAVHEVSLDRQGKQVDQLTAGQLDLTAAQSALANAQAVLTTNQGNLADTYARDRQTTQQQIESTAEKIDQLERRINRLQMLQGRPRSPYDESAP